jgi:hypothetical protein
MAKTIGLYAVIALLITVPIVIWADPLPTAAVSLIFLIVFTIVSAIGSLFKRNKGRDSTPIIIFVVGLVLINGCKVSPPGGHLSSRDYLNEKMKPSCAYGAYGYILFTEPLPGNKEDHEKMVLIAQMFQNVFEPQAQYVKRGVDPKDLMVMYWFLSDNNPVKKDISPDEMIGRYDYARAKMILSKLGKSGKRGPIFVAWSKPCASEMQDKEALIFDISDFDNDDIKRAFQIWNERVSQDPAYWKNGFQLEMFRSAFRNFLIKHSECLYKLLTKDTG